MTRNVYRLPNDIYNRKYDKHISKEVRKVLVGETSTQEPCRDTEKADKEVMDKNMTIEEAIYCMKSYVDNPHYEHCTSCPYYARNQIGSQTFVCESGQAHKLAIAALEYCRVKEVLLGRD